MGDRYERQARLSEVGERGQARIVASLAHIANDDASRVALAYLTRAGVERIEQREPAASFAHDAWFGFSGPRRVARGASVALDHLLSCLDLP